MPDNGAPVAVVCCVPPVINVKQRVYLMDVEARALVEWSPFWQGCLERGAVAVGFELEEPAPPADAEAEPEAELEPKAERERDPEREAELEPGTDPEPELEPGTDPEPEPEVLGEALVHAEALAGARSVEERVLATVGPRRLGRRRGEG